MEKIVVVEDDRKLREEVVCFLKDHGFEVDVVTDFSHSLESILSKKGNLILLDINLPGCNGEYLCRELRKKIDTPIMMITSRNNEMDEIISMSYGADDYITKPFNPEILLLHMDSILKRTKVSPTLLHYKSMTLHISKGVIEIEGREEPLSKNELKIFYYLLKNRGKIVPREDIMNFLWDTEEFIDDNTLSVNITRLRNKLESLGYKDIIETKRGQGYMIV